MSLNGRDYGALARYTGWDRPGGYGIGTGKQVHHGWSKGVNLMCEDHQ